MRKKMLAVLLASVFAGNVWAQDQTIKIAPQAMPAALHSLAGQTGIQLLFSAEELKGLQAKALSGAGGLVLCPAIVTTRILSALMSYTKNALYSVIQ